MAAQTAHSHWLHYITPFIDGQNPRGAIWRQVVCNQCHGVDRSVHSIQRDHKVMMQKSQQWWNYATLFFSDVADCAEHREVAQRSDGPACKKYPGCHNFKHPGHFLGQPGRGEHLGSLILIEPGVGVTKPISSVPLFSEFFSIVKTHFRYWISCLYLTGIAAAQLRWYLSNMNVIQIIWQLFLQDRKVCLWRN